MREVSPAKAYDAADEWSISPFPNGYTFAFTIVHDADSAYSRRLEPLFDVFDEFGFKITGTVFTFWADWARNGEIWQNWRESHNGGDGFFAPNSVPLVDENEREFYVQLHARGHEIGMHTPSETSDTRADVIRAFEYFKEVFGRYPGVYVIRVKPFGSKQSSYNIARHFQWVLRRAEFLGVPVSVSCNLCNRDASSTP